MSIIKTDRVNILIRIYFKYNMLNRQDNISDLCEQSHAMEVLAELQAGLTISRSLFGDLAEKVGLQVDELLSLLDKLLNHNILREISPVFNASGLGYISTLAAASVPEDNINDFVAYLNAMPGVSHNYGRAANYNVWFTLALPGELGNNAVFDEAFTLLRERFGLDDIISLPVKKMYKLKVNFGRNVRSGSKSLTDARRAGLPVAINEKDKQLVRLLQHGLPLCEYPFQAIADKLNEGTAVEQYTESEIIEKVKDWQAAGVIRRVAGRVRHYNLGYSHNAMMVIKLHDALVDEAGRVVASKDYVSHCYHRQRAQNWQYDLYAMIHAESQRMLDEYIAEIISELDYLDYLVLPTICEYKKQSVRYFE